MPLSGNQWVLTLAPLSSHPDSKKSTGMRKLLGCARPNNPVSRHPETGMFFMNVPLNHRLLEPVPLPARDLSGMPEAFQRAYGPTEPFPNDFRDAHRPDVTPLPYRGHRRINPRSRGSCRIFAVLPDLEAGQPRIYGADSQLEHHFQAVTLIAPDVTQIHEQFGPVPFVNEDNRTANHFIDLLITKTKATVSIGIEL